MEIDKSRTAEYAAPPAVARSSGLHLSSARDAKVERASHLPARAVAVPAPKAAPRTDRVAKRFNAEMGDMIEAQKKTQGEVSALAQQMKTMMGRQAQLDREMAHAVTEMGARKTGAKAPAAPAAVVPVQRTGERASEDEASFEKSESESVHKILQRELARLNLDKPVAPRAALGILDKAPAKARLRAKAARLQAQAGEASVRREMEAAILAGSKKEGLL